MQYSKETSMLPIRSAVFDPPFVAGTPKKAPPGIIKARFGYLKRTQPDLWNLYKKSLYRAFYPYENGEASIFFDEKEAFDFIRDDDVTVFKQFNYTYDDANGNLDGDRATNLQEYLEGTDPTDSLSVGDNYWNSNWFH